MNGVGLIAVSLHVPTWLKFVNVLECTRIVVANHTLQTVAYRVQVGGYPLWGVGVMTCMILSRSDRLHHQQRAGRTTSDRASDAMLSAVTICHLNNLLRNNLVLSTVTAILSQNLSQNHYFLPFLRFLLGKNPGVLTFI